MISTRASVEKGSTRMNAWCVKFLYTLSAAFAFVVDSATNSCSFTHSTIQTGSSEICVWKMKFDVSATNQDLAVPGIV